MKNFIITIILTIQCACVSSHKAPYQLPKQVQADLGSYDRFKNITVGVISPDLSPLNCNFAGGNNYGPYDDIIGKAQMTKRLVETLRETDYFYDVNFTNCILRKADILVEVQPHKSVPLASCGMGYYPAMISFGIFPAIIVDDKGNAFQFVSVNSTNTVHLEFEYETEELWGVFMFLPNLKRNRTAEFDQKLYIDSLRFLLVKHEKEILGLIEE